MFRTCSRSTREKEEYLGILKLSNNCMCNSQRRREGERASFPIPSTINSHSFTCTTPPSSLLLKLAPPATSHHYQPNQHSCSLESRTLTPVSWLDSLFLSLFDMVVRIVAVVLLLNVCMCVWHSCKKEKWFSNLLFLQLCASNTAAPY